MLNCQPWILRALERYSYDAWGKRRSATDWVSAVTTAYEQRGYTGHEHLDDIGIIHMNGRVYDSKLGRVLGPDSVTQAPENGQNYNRYTYALNNPLRYTDPSGFTGCDINAYYCPEAGNNSGSSGQVNGSWGGDISDIPGLGWLSGNGCDRTCKKRFAALNWCKAQSTCITELRANTREKYRRRSAQVIQKANETGQSYYYENGRAHLGDNTIGGAPGGQNLVVGADEVFAGIDNFIANNPGKPIPLGAQQFEAILADDAAIVNSLGLKDLSYSEYLGYLQNADSTFFEDAYRDQRFVIVGQPSNYGFGTTGADINYFMVGMVTAASGQSLTGLRALIVGHNVQDIFVGRPFFYNAAQAYTAQSWASYGYSFFNDLYGD